MASVRQIAFILLGLLSLSPAVPCSQVSPEVTARIDALVVTAYQAVSGKLPCKIGTTSRVHMMNWKDVGKCMDRAVNMLDWEEFSKRLQSLRPPNIPKPEFDEAVEKSLIRNALSYDRIFLVKDAKALLPLTNPVLKYLPPDSLRDQPVYDQSGKQIGKFAGVYSYERAGGLSAANMYTMSLFQYVDLAGRIQVPSEKLLLDSYGIPWDKVMKQPGFRLPRQRPVVTGR